MADGSRSRSKAEQLSQRPQKGVRNRFPGHPRTLSEQDPQEEITEQEPQQNENRETKNTDGSNETNNINNNNISAINSTDVGIRNVDNKYNNSSVPFLLGLLVLLVLAFFIFIFIFIYIY
ncbi:hypothetical protein PRUPE_1G184700 [Prunus persica]|uniref:Uncharacterized protein n=1 Tax=Prunus persica TaxID=3760 RepID=A0A251QZJ8_PRUPE|nr:hypothetical protein PRUPE_1G184700 [Prunus persica]